MEMLKSILAEENMDLVQKVCIFAGIIIIAFVLDLLCRRLIIPAIRKITAKTESVLDDHLLSDDVLKNISALIPPIAVYAMIQ